MPTKYTALVFAVVSGVIATCTFLPYGWAKPVAAGLSVALTVLNGAKYGTVAVTDIKSASKKT